MTKKVGENINWFHFLWSNYTLGLKGDKFLASSWTDRNWTYKNNQEAIDIFIKMIAKNQKSFHIMTTDSMKAFKTAPGWLVALFVTFWIFLLARSMNNKKDSFMLKCNCVMFDQWQHFFHLESTFEQIMWLIYKLYGWCPQKSKMKFPLFFSFHLESRKPMTLFWDNDSRKSSYDGISQTGLSEWPKHLMWTAFLSQGKIAWCSFFVNQKLTGAFAATF